MTRIDEALRRLTEGGAHGAPVLEQDLAPGDLWTSEGNPAEAAAAVPPRVEAAPVRNTPATAPEPVPTVEPAPAIPEHIQEKVLSATTTSAAAVEEYRRLGARLHLAQAERGIRTVMVASALAGEGKTLTATNLALTFSESYKRNVLLVDADLRRPSLHDMFGMPNIAGLNDGLTNQADRKVPLCQVRDHLTLLTAGRPERDPMSVFTSDRMRRVLDEAKRRFDWVIVDTPPVGVLTDAKLLAAYVDAVVFVIRAGETPATAIQDAIKALGREKVFGVVLNHMKKPAKQPEHYYPYVGSR